MNWTEILLERYKGYILFLWFGGSQPPPGNRAGGDRSPRSQRCEGARGVVRGSFGWTTLVLGKLGVGQNHLGGLGQRQWVQGPVVGSKVYGFASSPPVGLARGGKGAVWHSNNGRVLSGGEGR